MFFSNCVLCNGQYLAGGIKNLMMLFKSNFSFIFLLYNFLKKSKEIISLFSFTKSMFFF